jgi:hypothetical protein
MSINFNDKNEYYQYLQKDIKFYASNEEDPKMEEEVFADNMLEFLTESNFFEEPQACYHQGRGFKINGYDLNTPQNSIDIVVAIYKSGEDLVPNITKTEVDTAFKRAKTFLEKSRVGSGFYESLEDSVSARDLARTINQNYDNLKNSRIILITNGICGPFEGKETSLGDLKVSYQLWDFERVWRQYSSGMKKEYISIDFEKEGYKPIKCVNGDDGTGLYSTYIGIVTGQMLKNLYDKYGTRLLERNVRAFLQARSNVNRGIRDTIIERPNMFLAFNNGITVTANKIDFIKDESGTVFITKIYDFQVVNGGQTVASLWHTSVKNKASLDKVTLQMKLSIINLKEQIDEIAKKISQYSNAQNKVNTADFSANDPFHMKLEEVSKKIYAPDPTGGNLQTVWFYERARGTFQETRQRELTQARIKAWDRVFPKKQMFDKLVVAKLENTWRLKPHIVSYGGQKNFKDFTIYLKEQKELEKQIEINNLYFKNLISKFIIWKATEKIISQQKMPGYRANIVTYSLSWVIKNKPDLINLDNIWNTQGIGDGLEKVIDNVTRNVRNIVTATQGNVTEYCKKEDLWIKVRSQQFDLTTLPENKSFEKKITKSKVSFDDLIDIKKWEELVAWVKDSRKLSDRDLEFSEGIVRAIQKNGAPSMPQMKVSSKILQDARNKGFKG